MWNNCCAVIHSQNLMWKCNHKRVEVNNLFVIQECESTGKCKTDIHMHVKQLNCLKKQKFEI